MKKNNIFKLMASGALVLSMASCDSYLDKLPDNRTDINTETKVQELLTSAYPHNDYLKIAEFMSDNVDNMGENNPNTSRFLDQLYAWKDVTESDNEDNESLWESSNKAIGTANVVLQDIENMGGATTTTLKNAKAEALLCRAYNYFILTNIFCMNYNSSTSSKDLGVPYVTEPSTTVGSDYDRGTVADDYEKMDKDIQEALPLVGDSYYTVPKYHFNQRAAYAFACRFYLYYEKWDKAIEYANKCLGTQAKTMLRDWSYMGSMTADEKAWSLHYIDASLSCNLLLMTGNSSMGLDFGAYYYESKYSHNNYLAKNEDAMANNIWGNDSKFYYRMEVYQGTNLDKTLMIKLPYLFEETDAIAKTGLYHTVYPAFTADECLLNRAEAYIMMKQYDKACGDLNTWLHNFTASNFIITPDNVNSFYKSVAYATGLNSTIKKHLHPSFTIDAEGSVQESMLQLVLGIRRIETLHKGLRWFDVKRYGINIVRRTMGADGSPALVTDSLTTADQRRAVQLPTKVIQAGMKANPRAKQ